MVVVVTVLVAARSWLSLWPRGRRHGHGGTVMAGRRSCAVVAVPPMLLPSAQLPLLLRVVVDLDRKKKPKKSS